MHIAKPAAAEPSADSLGNPNRPRLSARQHHYFAHQLVAFALADNRTVATLDAVTCRS